jgi:transposase
MCKCQKCNSVNYVKNGNVRGKQRYICKDCKYTFVKEQKQVKLSNEVIDALVLLLYSTGKASCRFIGRLFGVSGNTISNWLKRLGKSYPNDNIPSEVKEIEIDEMWHFVHKKKENAGYLRHWIEGQGNALHGLQGAEVLRRFVSYIKSYPI